MDNETPLSINGIAHVVLTVHSIEKSAPFYREMCGEILGMTCVMDDTNGASGYSQSGFVYHVGGRTAIGICEQRKGLSTEFNQWQPGLHHLCFRMRSAGDVDAFHERFVQKLISLGGHVVHGPKDGPWAPGYRSALFEDPDGIRVEVNFVPGPGLLGTKDKKLYSKL